jgi:hypothetical protein
MKNVTLSTILEGLEKAVGPNVTAATYRKIARAKEAARKLDEQVEREAAREAAKIDFVVRLECQGHVVAVNRRALNEEEAKASAQRLCPAYRVFACEPVRRAQE